MKLKYEKLKNHENLLICRICDNYINANIMEMHTANCIEKNTKYLHNLLDIDKEINEICEETYKLKNKIVFQA